MTALQLLLWINASLALQALAFGSIAFYRYSRAYQALRRHAADHGVSEADLSIATPPMPSQGRRGLASGSLSSNARSWRIRAAACAPSFSRLPTAAHCRRSIPDSS